MSSPLVRHTIKGEYQEDVNMLSQLCSEDVQPVPLLAEGLDGSVEAITNTERNSPVCGCGIRRREPEFKRE